MFIFLILLHAKNDGFYVFFEGVTVAMAAHQICLQVLLAVSLLTDALVASGQVQNFVCKDCLIYALPIHMYLFGLVVSLQSIWSYYLS